MPDIWPGYDIIAQPPHPAAPQRISVKTRIFAKSGNFVAYSETDPFDWIAIVILPGPGCEQRRIFVVPRNVADARSYQAPHRNGRGFFVHKLIKSPRAGGRRTCRLREQLRSRAGDAMTAMRTWPMGGDETMRSFAFDAAALLVLAAIALIMLILIGQVRAEPLPYAKKPGKQCAGS